MFAFRVKLTVLVLALLPVLLMLGFWQLSRYEQKLSLEQAYEARHALDPLTPGELERQKDPLYMPLTVSGRFDRDRYFLLDNQVFQGEAGYELYMPFLTDEGQWLLVNRGWIPAGQRQQLPNITTDPAHLVLTGFAYKPLGKPFMLAEDTWPEGWPKRIQAYDQDKVAKALGQIVPDFYLVLGPEQAEQFRPMVVNLKSGKHMGYAVQWFAMALVMLLLYGFHMVRSGRNNNNNETRGGHDSH